MPGGGAVWGPDGAPERFRNHDDGSDDSESGSGTTYGADGAPERFRNHDDGSDDSGSDSGTTYGADGAPERFRDDDAGDDDDDQPNPFDDVDRPNPFEDKGLRKAVLERAASINDDAVAGVNVAEVGERLERNGPSQR